jgi:hypothetical protein
LKLKSLSGNIKTVYGIKVFPLLSLQHLAVKQACGFVQRNDISTLNNFQEFT